MTWAPYVAGAVGVGVAAWALIAYRSFDADRRRADGWEPETTNREDLHPKHRAALEERDRDD
jgi:hypothetical protein